MKLKALLPVLLLTACANMPVPVSVSSDEDAAETPVEAPKKSDALLDKVQELVAKTQEAAISSLPAEITANKSTYKTVESVADREKNQKGAGFTRVYGDDTGDVVITVFLYNNLEFGMTAEVSPATEALMDKHLQEFSAMQDSGLYDSVVVGEKNVRDLRWAGRKFQVLETPVSFNQREEAKKSYLVLGANPDLLSYVRIRFTYPQGRRDIERNKNIVTARILNALAVFAKDQKAQ